MTTMSNSDIRIKNYFSNWSLLTNITIVICLILMTLDFYALIREIEFSSSTLLQDIIESLNANGEISFSLVHLNGSSLAMMVMAFIWIYRANQNCRYLGARNLSQSPKWTILWWIVPIANFWKPYSGIKEIWKSSVTQNNWKEINTPIIIKVWWTTFILSIVMMPFIYIANFICNILPSWSLYLLDLSLKTSLSVLMTVIIYKIYSAQVISYSRLSLAETNKDKKVRE